MQTPAISVAAALAALLALPAAAGEKDHCSKHPPEPAATAAAAPAAPAPPAAVVQLRLPDEVLRDQEGRPLRLVSDVAGDGLVVMDFVFTTCTTICPLLSAIMSGVQQGLGDARDVSLVSVTVDPARDTPARLKAYAQKWKAKPGWTFLTGEREAIRRVLEAAGAYTADFTAHPPMVLVGDGRSDRWVRLNGFPKRAQVLATIDALRAERTTFTTAAGGAP